MTWRQGRISLTGVACAWLLCGCLRTQHSEDVSVPLHATGRQPSLDASMSTQASAGDRVVAQHTDRLSDYGVQRAVPVSRGPSHASEDGPETDPERRPVEEPASPRPAAEKKEDGKKKAAPPETPPGPLEIPAGSLPLPDAVLPQPRSAREPAGRLDPPAVAALRSLLENRSPAEVERLLQDYEPAQRDMLLGLLRGATSLSARKLDRIPPAEMATLVEHLDRMSMNLRPRASLVIDHMCFCRTITNFGQYEVLPADYCFQAGRDHWMGEEVKIYLEVRNFANHRNGEYYQTLLRGSLEIWDKDDKPVVPCKELKAEPCCSRTPRQDCFVNLWFRVPAGLSPGSYRVWVQMEDVTPAAERGDRPPRVARQALEFKVVGPGLPRRSARRSEGGMRAH